MNIPIFDGGTVIGRLALRREGLYTVLEAFLPAQKGLRRLWVAGGGKSADLGLCEPREDGLHFRRAYSRAALAALPSPLERAALDAVPAEPEPLSSGLPSSYYHFVYWLVYTYFYSLFSYKYGRISVIR